MTALKTGILGFFLVIVLVPLAHVSAWMDYGYDGNFFFPHGTGAAPREELIVYAWGPGTTAQSPFNGYNSYQQPYYQQYQPAYQPVYQPAYYYEPSYYEPMYQPQYSYAPSYSYPQYDYYQPQQPNFGYSPQPTGGTDFWGNDLCNWGPGYGGYPCDRDPHQWIYDPYTDSWY